MKRIVLLLCLALLGVMPARAGDINEPMHKVGLLHCTVLPHSGINLLIRSTQYIRCHYEPFDNNRSYAYKGETGIGFGIDLNLGKRTAIDYVVLAYADGEVSLSGRYSGAGGSASAGLNVGDSTPIARRDRQVSLQPIGIVSRGIGASLGFTYIYLEPDDEAGQAESPAEP